MPIVIYGIGSPIVADVAETCLRLGMPVAAWVANIAGPTFSPEGASTVAADEVTAALLINEFIVPLFTPGHRRSACDEAQRRGFTHAAVLIDPTAVVASSSRLAPGCYVNSMANIGAASRIGAFAFINRGASIGHHADISDFVSIGPGAIIAGGVRIGRGAVIGAGAIVLPEQEIGANAVVGAGAVVTKPVAAQTLVAGNPARVMRRGIAGYHDLSA
jgi:sugar O-acyltransferase (sialic acid O-acetyltransferase NeuD family)